MTKTELITKIVAQATEYFGTPCSDYGLKSKLRVALADLSGRYAQALELKAQGQALIARYTADQVTYFHIFGGMPDDYQRGLALKAQAEALLERRP